MQFSLWPALGAGFLAGLVKLGVRALLRRAGVPVKMGLLQMWGTLVPLNGLPPRLRGFAIHAVLSAGIALGYAWVFERLEVRTHLWLWGLLGGGVHWLIAGFVLAILPAMHREAPEPEPDPGAFVRRYGAGDMLAFAGGASALWSFPRSAVCLLSLGAGPGAAV